ncbi:MAG: DUF4430 domain-containing protein [Planctomycetota bacterium]
MAIRLTPSLILSALTTLTAIGCGTQRETVPTTGSGTVTIQVSVGEQDHVYQVDQVASGTTVEQVMRSVEGLPWECSGSGTTAFVVSLHDIPTTGDSGWIFRLDGEYSDVGIGTATVEPPTTIDWTFGNWDEQQ